MLQYVNNLRQRELVTAIECYNTTDYYILIILIFKGVYYLHKYFKNDLSDNNFFSRSESGFINNKLTLFWL